MKKGLAYISVISVLFLIALTYQGCDKSQLPPEFPEFRINVTIEPNSTLYQELNVVGGWMYLGYSQGIDPPSRGVIVYRWTNDEFVAYERTPPHNWNECCDQGLCTHLIVDSYYPFVFDTCTQTKFLLIDGSVTEGPSPYPLIKYQTQYDGNLLYIYN